MAKAKDKIKEETTSGFYKLFDDHLDYQPLYVLEFVDGIVQKLFATNKDSYEYPVYDWYWFDSLEEANAFFYKED